MHCLNCAVQRASAGSRPGRSACRMKTEVMSAPRSADTGACVAGDAFHLVGPEHGGAINWTPGHTGQASETRRGRGSCQRGRVSSDPPPLILGESLISVPGPLSQVEGSTRSSVQGAAKNNVNMTCARDSRGPMRNCGPAALCLWGRLPRLRR
jgi:hypothetical protein